ncbi:NDP-hexose 2,3-dehydratase family protein [Kordiimonas sp.]|uniref:NDP-hexose 2,3-dehydratase family protein n=1 Tax=Kordiimonas sp. TaxID=1970157 RepID=UPI003A9129DA
MLMLKWLEERRAACQMRFEEIRFADSREWRLTEKGLVHETGGFFSVQGIAGKSMASGLSAFAQPIINQPEIGILGFIVSGSGGAYRWLVQAKAEPGNVGTVQLAPSVQATYSNYTRKHGGAATHYLECFAAPDVSIVGDSLQSEQGTRFLTKFNRNMLCDVSCDLPLVNEQYCWFSAAQMRAALALDFAINTDARSVIVCSPWKYLADPKGAFGGTMPIQRVLSRSYAHTSSRDIVGTAQQKLDKLRLSMDLQLETVPLEALSGWRFGDTSIVVSDAGESSLEVRHYHVTSPEREKDKWDQPLVLSTSSDEVMLFCQQRDGVLHFLLRPAYEVGLTGGVEFGPSHKLETVVTQPEWLRTLAEHQEWETLIQVEQSDEGGRFMGACCVYSIRQIPANYSVFEDTENFWVTLQEVEKLCAAPGILTNEARSVISLLLAFI